MSIFALRFLHRSRFVEQFIDEWAKGQDTSDMAVDVEELVNECMDLGALGCRTWETARTLLLEEPNAASIHEAEKILQKAMKTTLKNFTTVRRLIAEAVKRGLTIKNHSALESTGRDLQRLDAKIRSVFPPFDQATADEARSAFLRGECMSVEEMIEELSRDPQDVGAPVD